MNLANMGVKSSDHWGTWDVSYCYYGMLDGDGTYITFDQTTNERVTIKPKARWSVESLTPNTKATADALWAIRDRITDLVAERDPQVPKARVDGPFAFLVDVFGADTGGIPQARLRVERTDEGWTITEYDWGRWSASLIDSGERAGLRPRSS